VRYERVAVRTGMDQKLQSHNLILIDGGRTNSSSSLSQPCECVMFNLQIKGYCSLHTTRPS
jgi:hypothetical protein